MPTWCLRDVNSDIKWSRLNRAIRRSRLNRVIGWLKSHGVESASWATIPPITRDPTAEITRSEIRVVGHQFHAIRRLKSHRVESASWATIPPITHDPTAEITRGEICVMGHQFRAIRRLKSHGVKSALWATIHQFRTNFSINRCSLPL